jgi:hypothetical protein
MSNTMAGPKRRAKRVRVAGLIEFSRVCILDGDVVRCRVCECELHMSGEGDELRHRAGCCYAGAEPKKPWAALRGILLT